MAAALRAVLLAAVAATAAAAATDATAAATDATAAATDATAGDATADDATATVVEAGTINVMGSEDSFGCLTKAWGVTSGQPAPIKPATLPNNVYDFDVQISNPCPLGKKVGIIVTVCDPDATPDITIYSADEVHVHRFLPIRPASFSGKVFCLVAE